ncbi:MAG: pilus assembly protein PilM [Spirochaetes bacterium]|nr:pilus assembly protein PilM [Spirochaetota bacterium]
MFDNIVSIDIGASSIKLIKARRSIKNFEITAALIEEINPDEAQTDYAAALRKSIFALKERENLAESSVILTVTSDLVFFRNITFPFSDMGKIREAIPFEAEENIPYPSEKIVMDFQPLPQSDTGARSVILAAINRDILNATLEILSETGLDPVFAGLESNALVKSYDYFNSVNNETVLLVDIGHNKTVISIIRNNHLLYNRSINAGTGQIISNISDILRVSLSEASGIFETIDIDLNTTESGMDKVATEGLNITKPKMKKIYSGALETVNTIISDLLISIKSSGIVNDYSDFSRIMLSGGGSNIKGIGRLFGDESGLPVVFMPFVNEFSDRNIRSRLSICLGNLLVFMNNRNDSINFLKERSASAAAAGWNNRFGIAKLFIIMSIAVFIVNLMLTFYSVYKTNSYSDEQLRQKYKRYFNTSNIPKDPVVEASKILQKERQELKVLKDMIGEHSSFTAIIGIVTKTFSGIPGFYVKKMSFEGNDMTIEGEVKNSSDLEQYKKNILQTGRFETVTVNITDTNRARSLFRMIIKQKSTTEQR